MQFFTTQTRSTAAKTAPELFAELDELMQQRSDRGNRLLIDDGAFVDTDRAIAAGMQALAADGTLLRSFMAAQVRSRKIPPLQGAQSFFVYNSAFLTARINLWFPQDERVGNVDSLRRYLSVGEMHNHDFSFYTINLLGPGYTTHFYRDVEFRSDLTVGDRPMLEDMGTHALNDDRVLFVEAFNDYHSQMWPAAFSVTLNLIAKMAAKDCAIQYILGDDLSIKTVADSNR